MHRPTRTPGEGSVSLNPSVSASLMADSQVLAELGLERGERGPQSTTLKGKLILRGRPCTRLTQKGAPAYVLDPGAPLTSSSF